MATIGERIKELRFEKGLTQKAMAQHLSVTVPTLSHWECNYQEPSSRDLSKLCDFFDVSADYLLGRTDDLGNISLPSQSTPSRKERELLAIFRQMTDAQQNRFLGIGEGMIEGATAAERRKK